MFIHSWWYTVYKYNFLESDPNLHSHLVLFLAILFVCTLHTISYLEIVISFSTCLWLYICCSFFLKFPSSFHLWRDSIWPLRRKSITMCETLCHVYPAFSIRQRSLDNKLEHIFTSTSIITPILLNLENSHECRIVLIFVQSGSQVLTYRKYFIVC